MYGAKAVEFGSVCTEVADGTLTVRYSVLFGWTIQKVHVLVGTSVPTVTAPGQFPYSNGKGSCSISVLRATCSFPVQDQWRGCEKDLYLATHIAAINAGKSQTGWSVGSCYDNKSNRAKYWKIRQSCRCPSTYTTTSEFVYTVTFPDETKTATCDNPNKGATVHVTTTQPIPASWTPPA